MGVSEHDPAPRADEGAGYGPIPYRDLVEQSPQASFIHCDGLLVYANPAGAHLLGLPNYDFLGKPAIDYIHADRREEVRQRSSAALRTGAAAAAETTLLRADGTAVQVETRATRIDFHGKPAMHVICWDVDERARREQQLTVRADYDPLTGLLRREPFLTRAAQALTDAAPGTLVAILVADMDRFKEVNDTYGHLVGDEVLAAIGGRLAHAVRGDDQVGRFGGDEFLILARQLKDENGLRCMTNRIRHALTDPVALRGGHSLHLGVSLGSATFTPPLRMPADVQAWELLKAADLRSLRAKPVQRGSGDVDDS